MPSTTAPASALNAAMPKRRRRQKKNPYRKAKKAKTSQTGSTEKKTPPALPTEMFEAIFRQIDSPITAVCFSLANKKCRKIFQDLFSKQFPDNASIPLLSAVEYRADGTRIKLCALLASWFGKRYAFYHPYEDKFIRPNKAKMHGAYILEYIAGNMMQYMQTKEQERMDRFEAYQEQKWERARERQQYMNDKRDMLRCGDPDYDSDEYVDSDEDDDDDSEDDDDESLSGCSDGGDPDTRWLREEGYSC